MPSQAAEVVRIRREDRPQSGFGQRTRRVSRAIAAAPDDWARAFNTYVIAGQVAARIDSAESASVLSAWVDADLFNLQTRVLETRARYAEARVLLERIQSYLEGSFSRVEPAESVRLEQPDSEREIKLYKEELKRLRLEQEGQNQHSRQRRRKISPDLDEAIALAHPIALRLLGWLHVSCKLDLGGVFEVFGASSSTFEGVARLHLLGALKFDDGRLTITPVGTRFLKELGIIEDKEGGT